MVLFNHAAHQMAAKIVYYGPGLCGKTTNLSVIYQRTSQKARGEMVSLNTDTDRTLFFDLLPMDMGMIWGFRTKLQLYTVPGQVFYNATRKLVLKGADGIVFVTDSQAEMLESNRESLRNLEANLAELGLDPQRVPLVFQWNKRDLDGLTPVEVLERELNPDHRPSFCSVANKGTGVFETLKGVARETLLHLKTHHFTSAGAPIEAVATPEPPPVRAVPAPRPAVQGKLAILPLRPKVPGPAPRPASARPPTPPRVPTVSLPAIPKLRTSMVAGSTVKPARPTPPPAWDPEVTAV